MNASPDNTTTAGLGNMETAPLFAGRPPTVLQVLPALGQGGVERGTVEVAAAVTAAGGRAIVASAGGMMEHALKRAGAEHVTLPLDSKNPLVMRGNVGRLVDLIKAEGVDVIHARSRAPAWSALPAARRTGIHFVTTFHGTYNASWWGKRRYNAIMTRGERVIAISRFIAGHMHKIYGTPASRIRVIHRGVDVARFDPAMVSAERVIKLARAWRLDEGLPVVMLPGRLTRWKGQTVFLDAVAELGRRDIRVLLVGSDQGRTGYRDELESQIRHLDLGGVVRLVDHCDDMPAAYMLADVVVSASTDPEAFGRVAVEGQAMGRPVVATDHGGSRETVIEGETGWRVTPGDSAALAVGLGKALGLDPAARHRMAARAVANARDNFSTAVMCARVLAVYDEVLGVGPGPEPNLP